AGPAIAAVDAAGDTVSVYTPSHDDKGPPFLRTGNYPGRLAAADLSGHRLRRQPLDELGVAHALYQRLPIAFQTPDSQFRASIPRPVGIGPSEITFADLDGQDGPDIVVSDQVSGDITVLFNDPTHSFSRQARYRAGIGPFGIDTS